VSTGKKCDSDIENNWAFVAEAIQTVLRREGFQKPYEALLDKPVLIREIPQGIIIDL
jgi:hypothetical protein